jgi:hypothetical protein
VAVFRSSWLIGSVRDLPVQNFEADGVAASVATGNYYLAGPVTALSLRAAFQAALIAAGVADALVVITQSRTVRITASETFTLEWGDATRLRDLLGFSADLLNLDTHQAPLVSPLLWSPARPGRSMLSPQLTRGIRRPLNYYAVSPSDGSVTVVSHGAREYQRLEWSMIANDRIFTTDELGGEFVSFFEEVLAKGASFYHYPEVVEDASVSATTATLLPFLGPYVFSPKARATTWAYDRADGFKWTDRRQDIDLDIHVTPQYPT